MNNMHITTEHSMSPTIPLEVMGGLQPNQFSEPGNELVERILQIWSSSQSAERTADNENVYSANMLHSFD